MSTIRSLALGVSCLAAAWLPVAASAAARSGAVGGDTPICEQALPAATDGTLTLDTPTVQAGTEGLGVLADFEQWPVELVGGGSGETFLSCTPWSLSGEAEVMPNEDAALFLFDVPAGTAPGAYPVSVVFYEVSQQTPGDDTLVRLSTTVTVSSAPTSGVSDSPACALPGSQASVGQLLGDDEVAVGGVVSLTLSGVPGAALSRINEYDDLWYVACLDGAATAIVQDATPPMGFELAVPAGLPTGAHTVRLYAVLDDAVVWWEHVITVADAPAPPAVGTVTIVQASCASVTVRGTGWGSTDATIELAVPPSEGGESPADLVAGPVRVVPDAQGDLPPTELRFTTTPRDGRYAVVVLVDDTVTVQSSGFTLSGCEEALPATGSGVVPVAALGIAMVAIGLVLVGRSRAHSTSRVGDRPN
jgi:LPXTG-motif cell wall-anchored protein